MGSGVQDQYGVNAGPTYDPSIPRTGNYPNQTRGTGHSSTTGKIEHALGSMIGSTELKAKGLQKQQYVLTIYVLSFRKCSCSDSFREANSMKIRDRDLAAAERLEREAAMRRERAVAHGMPNIPVFTASLTRLPSQEPLTTDALAAIRGSTPLAVERSLEPKFDPGCLICSYSTRSLRICICSTNDMQ
jgi:hypothetical protein